MTPLSVLLVLTAACGNGTSSMVTTSSESESAGAATWDAGPDPSSVEVMGPGMLVPKISQRDPAGVFPGYDGGEFCGPTDVAMTARAEQLGQGLTDAELIQQLADVAGTTSSGTTPDGVVTAAQSLGMDTVTAAGLPDFGWVQQELATGRTVILRGDYFALPPHQNASRYAGHYILVTGWAPTLGEFLVNDPADLNVRWEQPADLTEFVQMHSNFNAQSTYETALGGPVTDTL